MNEKSKTSLVDKVSPFLNYFQKYNSVQVDKTVDAKVQGTIDTEVKEALQYLLNIIVDEGRETKLSASDLCSLVSVLGRIKRIDIGIFMRCVH